MRLSRKQGLGRLALALGVAVLIAPASAGAAGLLHIEISPSPTVEVPGVVTVQAPPIPGVTLPPAPTVEVPAPTTTGTLPTGEPPTTTAPVAESGKASASSGDGASGSSSNPTAPSASTPASAGTGTGAATPSSAGTTGSSDASATRSGAPSARRAAAARRARRRSASAATNGAHAGAKDLAAATSPTAAAGPTTRNATKPARTPPHRSSAKDPLASLGRHLPIPLPVPDWSKPIILLLLLVAVGFAVRSQLAARRARGLERRQATLLHDLDAMQAALVPAIPARLGALSVSVAYRPADGPAAGGDFYDLFALGAGRVAIVLGDVAGHGREALEQAALTRYTLRAYMQAGLEPRSALALAGSVLTQPGTKRFATVVIAVHDGASGRLTYASAGHPPPIWTGFAAPEPITICGSAPICCELPTGHRQTTISLPARGRVCFFSDGLLEARVGRDGLLERERLVELLELPGPPPSAATLLERVREAATTTPDDMVACIVSPAGRVPPSSETLEELEVDQQALSGPRVASFLEACGLQRAELAPLLARAGEIARIEGKALLRVKRSEHGAATATAQAGLAIPAWADGLRALLPA